jgi:hypothetical protein
MKKVFVFICATMIGGLSLAFAAGPEPGELVLNGFKKEFSSAENVSWDKQDEYDKATFVLGGRRVVAYFNSEGKMEGCVRDLFFDQLPLAVMTAVDRKYGSSNVLDIREITNEEGTSYRLTVEVKKKMHRVKVTPDGNISLIEKLK